MNRANYLANARLAPVQSSVLDGINRLKMFRSTARMDVALVMHVLRGRPMKRFVNEPMHFFEPPFDTDVAIPMTILGAAPKPAFSGDLQMAVKPHKSVVSEHQSSIHRLRPQYNTARRAARKPGHEVCW